MTLASVRHDRFDYNHGLFYSPLSYEPRQAPEISAEVPDEVWIQSAFESFVRAEFGGRQSKLSANTDIPRDSAVVDLIERGITMRDQYEQSLIYGGTLSDIVSGIS